MGPVMLRSFGSSFGLQGVDEIPQFGRSDWSPKQTVHLEPENVFLEDSQSKISPQDPEQAFSVGNEIG